MRDTAIQKILYILTHPFIKYISLSLFLVERKKENETYGIQTCINILLYYILKYNKSTLRFGNERLEERSRLLEHVKHFQQIFACLP